MVHAPSGKTGLPNAVTSANDSMLRRGQRHMTPCPSRDHLVMLSAHRLDPALRADVQTHVDGCPQCQTTLESMGPGPTQNWQPPADEAPAPLSSADVPEELRRHPRYCLTRVLGRGGMGAVFQAQHRLLDRQVVLKVIRPELLDNPSVVQRFERESRLAARLNHPNVVAVYEAEKLGRAQILVMEFIEGVNLAELVSQRGLLPVAESCALAHQAALGLQYMHEQGLVHRDIKPTNLIVTPAGVVKILDMGLATLKTGASHSDLTADRQFLGTVDFAAPEQWESSRDVDIRADIYSLGCTLYYLLAGQAPFPSSKYSTTMQQMWAHSQAPRPPISELRPDVPEPVAAIVDRMLAKTASERFNNPAEVADALRPFVADCDLAEFVRTARRTTTSRIDLSRIASTSPSKARPAPATPAAVNRRAFLAAGGALAAALALGGAYLAFRPGRAAPPVGGNAGSAAAAAAKPAGAPIKVGVLHSVTGTMAISERAVIDATLMAIDELNSSGGLLGRPVEAVVEDGKSNWNTFAEKSEKLIVADKVCTLFGCWTSASRKTVLPILEKHNHLLFYPVQYEGLELSPYVVYTGAAPNQQIIPAVHWTVKSLKKTRFFLVGSDYVFPRCANAIIRDTAASLGAVIVGEEYIVLGSSDAGQIAEKIVAASPEIIFNTVNGDSNVALFRALRAAGIKSEAVPTISFSISEQELSSLNTGDIAGDYAAWNYFQSIARPQNQRFVERFKARYGAQRVITDPMEAAYFGVYLWAQAVRQAGTDDVPAVRAAIKNQEFDAPEGVVRIDPETQHTIKVFRIGQITEQGDFKVVYSPQTPVTPIPYPATRSKGEWDAFLMDLHLEWKGNWANPGR
jgi:urea transport system substrate-binding protein